MIEKKISVQNEEADLLDLLVTVAENIRLLIIGPLLAGILALGAVSFWPASYESSFILEGQKKIEKEQQTIDLFTPMQVSQLFAANAVFTEAAKELQNEGKTQLLALLHPGAVSVQVIRNSTHVQVTVKAQDPASAYAAAQALLKACLTMSKPQGEDLQYIQANLEKNKNSLASARLMESRISVAINSTDRADPALAQAYMKLLDTIPNLVKSIANDRVRLNGLTIADVLVQPAVATASVGPKRIVVFVSALLAAGFVLLLWVFTRQAFQKAAMSDSSFAKIARIRKALGIKASA